MKHGQKQNSKEAAPRAAFERPVLPKQDEGIRLELMGGLVKLHHDSAGRKAKEYSVRNHLPEFHTQLEEAFTKQAIKQEARERAVKQSRQMYFSEGISAILSEPENAGTIVGKIRSAKELLPVGEGAEMQAEDVSLSVSTSLGFKANIDSNEKVRESAAQLQRKYKAAITPKVDEEESSMRELREEAAYLKGIALVAAISAATDKAEAIKYKIALQDHIKKAGAYTDRLLEEVRTVQSGIGQGSDILKTEKVGLLGEVVDQIQAAKKAQSSQDVAAIDIKSQQRGVEEGEDVNIDGLSISGAQIGALKSAFRQYNDGQKEAAVKSAGQILKQIGVNEGNVDKIISGMRSLVGSSGQVAAFLEEARAQVLTPQITQRPAVPRGPVQNEELAEQKELQSARIQSSQLVVNKLTAAIIGAYTDYSSKQEDFFLQLSGKGIFDFTQQNGVSIDDVAAAVLKEAGQQPPEFGQFISQAVERARGLEQGVDLGEQHSSMQPVRVPQPPLDRLTEAVIDAYANYSSSKEDFYLQQCGRGLFIYSQNHGQSIEEAVVAVLQKAGKEEEEGFKGFVSQAAKLANALKRAEEEQRQVGESQLSESPQSERAAEKKDEAEESKSLEEGKEQMQSQVAGDGIAALARSVQDSYSRFKVASAENEDGVRAIKQQAMQAVAIAIVKTVTETGSQLSEVQLSLERHLSAEVREDGALGEFINNAARWAGEMIEKQKLEPGAKISQEEELAELERQMGESQSELPQLKRAAEEKDDELELPRKKASVAEVQSPEGVAEGLPRPSLEQLSIAREDLTQMLNRELDGLVGDINDYYISYVTSKEDEDSQGFDIRDAGRLISQFAKDHNISVDEVDELVRKRGKFNEGEQSEFFAKAVAYAKEFELIRGGLGDSQFSVSSSPYTMTMQSSSPSGSEFPQYEAQERVEVYNIALSSGRVIPSVNMQGIAENLPKKDVGAAADFIIRSASSMYAQDKQPLSEEERRELQDQLVQGLKGQQMRVQEGSPSSVSIGGMPLLDYLESTRGTGGGEEFASYMMEVGRELDSMREIQQRRSRGGGGIETDYQGSEGLGLAPSDDGREDREGSQSSHEPGASKTVLSPTDSPLMQPMLGMTGKAGFDGQMYTKNDFMHETLDTGKKMQIGAIGLISMLLMPLGGLGVLIGLAGLAYCAFTVNEAQSEAALKAKEANNDLMSKRSAASDHSERDLLNEQMQKMMQMNQQQFQQMSSFYGAMMQPRVQQGRQNMQGMSGTSLASQSGFGESVSGAGYSYDPGLQGQVGHSSSVPASHESGLESSRSSVGYLTPDGPPRPKAQSKVKMGSADPKLEGHRTTVVSRRGEGEGMYH